MTEPPSIRALLLGQLRAAHGILESTVADVDDALANKSAPGLANPIGSAYAHAVISEDANGSRWLSHSPPLCLSDWSGRTGSDQPMPMRGFIAGDLANWYKEAKVAMPTLREYAKAVYQNTERLISATDDEAFASEVDTPLGKMQLAMALAVFVVGHVNNLSGEISAMKGVFGRKGYPF
jgi:DinB superfamily